MDRRWRLLAELLNHQSQRHKRNLRSLDLRGVVLAGVHLPGSSLALTDLRGADLQGADLRRSDLRGANLTGVNMPRANLRGTDLRGARLSSITLTRARYDAATRWPAGFDPRVYGAIRAEAPPASPSPRRFAPVSPRPGRPPLSSRPEGTAYGRAPPRFSSRHASHRVNG